jgi:glycosyltransferase involved in cell wall biosynthesis
MRLLICTQVLDEHDPILGFFHHWVEEFSQECESVIVICLKEGNHSLPSNVQVLSLGKERGASRVKYLFNFYSHIWSERKAYDAVFVHMNQVYVLLGGAFWHAWGKKIGLWYVHRSVTFSLEIATMIVDRIFTTSPESFRIATRKRLMLGHGIDTARFAPGAHIESDTLRLLTVGRIAETKGILMMLQVAGTLRAQGIGVMLTIVGAGVLPADIAYEAMLRAYTAAHDLADTVRFAGAMTQEELPAMYASADVFLNFSATGSMDKAVLEALACGTPVVTTNAAFKELLGASGLYVNTRDMAQLGAAIQKAKGMDMAAYRVRIVSEHSLERLVPQIVAALA